MGLLDSLSKKVQQEWAQNLTLEQIEEYERQGVDMSAYRPQCEERIAAEKKQEQELTSAMAMDKLDVYKNARSAEDAFVVDVAKFNDISNKKKSQLELAPLVYGRVVQAHHSLFKPGKDDGRTGIVFLFALDDEHRYNEEWLAKTATRISEMKTSVNENKPEGFLFSLCRFLGLEQNAIISNIIETKQLSIIPEDCRKFIKTLRNDRSYFCFPLGASLNDGADAWCATYTLDKQSKLPLSCIPYNKIIPFLLSEQPKENRFAAIQLIPPAYYTK